MSDTPLTTTSTGAGEPKLITWLTMSAGSNVSRTSLDRLAARSGGTPSATHFRSSHPGRCLSSRSRTRRFTSSTPPAPGFSATRSMTSSGPPIHRYTVLIG